MVLRNGGTILTALDRITQPVTDFIRGNVLVSTAALGIGTTGLVLGAIAVRKRRKKKRAAKKRVSRRRVSRKKKKKKAVTHRSPRHKGHKKVSFTTKGGKRVSFLVKKKAHTHKSLRKRRKKR